MFTSWSPLTQTQFKDEAAIAVKVDCRTKSASLLNILTAYFGQNVALDHSYGYQG